MTLPSNTELNSASQELLDALDTHLPECIHGEARRDEIICTGEHTFAVYRWTNHSGACRADEMACHLRLQFVMPDNTLWIGRLEICNDFRRQGLGSRIVCSIEMAGHARQEFEGSASFRSTASADFGRNSATETIREIAFSTKCSPKIIEIWPAFIGLS